MDKWLSNYGVTLGVGALILFMIFIVWDLARRSNAGKFGTVILYVGLAMGILGFLIKVIITYLLENAGMDVSKVRSGVLAASLAAGDVAVERILKQAARWIGVAVGNVVNLLGPDIVVLGGGLVEAMPELFCEQVDRSARKRVMPAFEKTFRVVAAELGDDATAAGAAAWARSVVDAAG